MCVLILYYFCFAGNVTLSGRAWAGGNAITRVLVSVDGGNSWQEAKLAPKPVGKFAWIGWTFEWKNIKVGKYFIMSKAIDDKGNVQDEEDVWNYYAMGSTVPQSVPVLVVSKDDWIITGKKLQNGPKHPKL